MIQLRVGGAEILSEVLAETPYQNHDFDGFYVRDIDGNVLSFFNDYHDLYTPFLWDWSWEEKITPVGVLRLKKSLRTTKSKKFYECLVVIAILLTLFFFFVRRNIFLNLIIAFVMIILFNILHTIIRKIRR